MQRAATALQRLSGALSVEVGAVDRAILRRPYALVLLLVWTRGITAPSLDTRLPLEYLTQPVGAGEVWAADGGPSCWPGCGESEGGDLLMIIHRPRPRWP